MSGESRRLDVSLHLLASSLGKLASRFDSAHFDWVPRRRHKTAGRLTDLGRRKNKGAAAL